MKRIGTSKLCAYSIIGIFLSLTLSHCGKWNTNNPTVPVGPTLRVGSAFTLPGVVEAMAAKDNLLYICINPFSQDSSANLFYVVDASDLMNPQVIGSTLDRGQYGYVYGLALYGPYAYVNTYFEGLAVLDISNPAAPGVLASYDTLSAIPAGISGSHLYAIGYGLDYISLSDPIHPRREGRSNVYNDPRLVAPWDETRCVLYDDRNDRVVVVDFTSPVAPKTVAYSSETYLRGLAVSAGCIFGVRDSKSPAVLRFTWEGGDSISSGGQADLPGEGQCLTDVGHRIVVGANSFPDLFLLSTAGPMAPYVVAESSIPWLPYSIEAEGNRLYVNDGRDIFFVEVIEH